MQVTGHRVIARILVWWVSPIDVSSAGSVVSRKQALVSPPVPAYAAMGVDSIIHLLLANGGGPLYDI